MRNYPSNNNPRARKAESLKRTIKTSGSIDAQAKARARAKAARIQEAREEQEALQQALAEQQEHQSAIDPSNLGITGPATRRSTRKSRGDAMAMQKAIEEQTRQQLEEQRKQSLVNRPQAPAGHRSDRQLHMAFIQMGQGDCAVISTPDGTSILIDCGSTATESAASWEAYSNRIQGYIYGPKFLQNYNKIDILILTHPDQDHYNMLKWALSDTVKIATCYHSCAFKLYSQDKQSDWIWKHMETMPQFSVKEVTAKENRLRTFTINNERSDDPKVIPIPPQEAQTQQAQAQIERLDARYAIRIIEEDNCKISILASNVTTRSRVRDDNTNNINSIVLLIEAFGKTIMICGDATGGTEEFVCATYPNIQNLDILQVPHHGSPRTSSTPNFIAKMKPRMCIISAPKDSRQHNHPVASVIDDYLNSGRIDDVANQHEIFYWVGVEGAYQNESRFIQKALYITGSYGTLEFTFSA